MLAIWDDLVEMLHRSILIQAIITLITVIVIAYKWATNAPISDQEYQVLWLVLGFFFGAKSALSNYQRRKET